MSSVAASFARPRGRALALVLLAGLLLWLPYRHFTTDDAFIHLRFARNLGSGDGFAFNPGEPTYGDTAPGWVLLVAAAGRLLESAGVPGDPARAIAPLPPTDQEAPRAGLLDVVVYRTDAWRLAAKLLDLACMLCVVVLFARLAHGLMGAGWLAATLLFLVDPWMIKWSLSGMETPLAVLLALAAFWRRRVARDGDGIDWQTPLVLGLGLWIRPEFCLLLVASALDVAVADRRRRGWTLLAHVAVPALVYAPWLVYAWWEFGTIVPNTFAARRDVNYSTGYVLWKMARILGSAYAVPLLALGVGLIARRRIGREQVMPLAAVALLLAFYAIWHVSVGSRYLLLVLPFVLLLGYEALFARFRTRGARGLVVTVLAVVLLGVQLSAVSFASRWPLGLDRDLFAIAAWLDEETGAGARVAAHEIGVLGHVGQRHVVDLAALVSPEVVPYSRSGSVRASLEGQTVSYLVWNANVSPDTTLLADMGDGLEPLLVHEVHREGSSHRGGWQYYTVYAIRR